MSVEIINLAHICRTCMSEASADNKLNAISLNCSPQNSTSIAELLSITNRQLNVNEHDELPKFVCSFCLNRLLEVHEFQKMCVDSDERLRELLVFKTEGVLERAGASTLTADRAELSGLRSTEIEIECVMEHLSTEESADNVTGVLAESIVVATDQLEKPKDEGHNEMKYGLEEFIATANVETAQEYREEEEHDENVFDVNWEKEFIRNDSNEEDVFVDNAAKSRSVRKSARLDKLYKCQDCERVFNRLYSLNRHRRVHDIAPEQEQIEFILEGQEKQEHDTDDIVAAEATTTTTTDDQSPANLEEPKQTAESPDYKCDECDKVFIKLSAFNRHKSVHKPKRPETRRRAVTAASAPAVPTSTTSSNNSAKPYVCDYCDKAFHQSCTLKDHMRIHTGEQPFLCSECGKSFNCAGNLRQHQLRHTGLKRYECPDCPKRFPCISDLASHKAVHNRVKPYQCDLCGAAFGKPFLLKKHKMYHNGEKPHKCEYCEKRFVSADHMRRHARTHTGEKPYKCKYCERGFSQSNDLIKHVRRHVGEKVYRCELCPEAFRLATELRQHFAAHKNDSAETQASNLRALQAAEEVLRAKFPPIVRSEATSVDDDAPPEMAEL